MQVVGNERSALNNFGLLSEVGEEGVEVEDVDFVVVVEVAGNTGAGFSEIGEDGVVVEDVDILVPIGVAGFDG